MEVIPANYHLINKQNKSIQRVGKAKKLSSTVLLKGYENGFNQLGWSVDFNGGLLVLKKHSIIIE